MAMFDSELLKRFEYLSLVARQAGGRSLVTRPCNKLPGGGTEVTGLRDYAPGDEYRHIDWTLCARRDELLTRTFEGDEDLHVYILLDCSPSMGLGRPAKFHLARQIAAVLGYAVLANLDCLSVSAFSDALVADLPPIRHRARAAALLRFLEQLSLQGTRTDLARTAEGFVRRYQRHGPVVVISDLYDRNGFQRGLDVLQNRGYEPRVVQVYELARPNPGCSVTWNYTTWRPKPGKSSPSPSGPHGDTATCSPGSAIRFAVTAPNTAWPVCRSPATRRRTRCC